jgi:hypothetical protein
MRRIPTYKALRARDVTYVEYETGERELYDLRRDPFELDNAFTRADPAQIEGLARQLAAMRSCAAAICRTADAMGR